MPKNNPPGLSVVNTFLDSECFKTFLYRKWENGFAIKNVILDLNILSKYINQL